MSVEFDWHVSEDEFDKNEQKMRSTPPWVRWGGMLVLLLVVGAIGGGLWWQVYSAELQLRRSAQFILDLEHEAYISGDGDLLFSIYDPEDMAFQSAQLRPDQQAIHAVGEQVTHAELHDDIIWANTTWQQDGETRQRIAFFKQTENGMLHIASDADYWGNWQETPFEWGALRLHSADSQWTKQIGEHIAQSLAGADVSTASTERLPTVVIRSDFAVSPLPNVINYPSPRLLGLDEDGELHAAYLDGLDAALAAYFQPIQLRFALPRQSSSDVLILRLADFAADFAAHHAPREIDIEFVIIDPAEDAATWLPMFDAALWPATEALIKQGHLFDLTQIAASDAAFDHGDFYDQAWRGAWWGDRMWLVPWNTSLNLVYYNRKPFRDLNIAQPDVDWHWGKMTNALQQLALEADAPPFIDPTRDTLYAYAYAQDRRCADRADCVPALTEDGVLATLQWYRQLVADERVVVDLASVPEPQRVQTTLKALSAHKEVAAWVDTPNLYEYQLGLQTTAVVPLMPIDAETPLVLPVRVHGMVMSQATDHPYWTWEWIKFLSHQTPPTDLRRNIPARPSVVRQSKFWEWLPEPLAGPMQIALPYSRPILIGEERYLTWEMLAAAVRAERIEDISAEPAPLRWFSQE